MCMCVCVCVWHMHTSILTAVKLCHVYVSIYMYVYTYIQSYIQWPDCYSLHPQGPLDILILAVSHVDTTFHSAVRTADQRGTDWSVDHVREGGRATR